VKRNGGLRSAKGSLAVTWLGHASALLELDGVRLLTDPLLRRRVAFLRRLAAPVPPAAYADVDVVLLSHLHADHADLRSLRMLGPEVEIVAPPAAAEWVRARGFRRVRALAIGERAEIGGASVEATPADHDGRRLRRGPPADAAGFLVEGSQSVYFAGDTDLFAAMAELAGRVDVALVPVWGWGPSIGPGHLDPERAAQAVTTIRPRIAIPIHWGTYAPLWARPAPEALTEPARVFAGAAGTVARVLAPGERVVVPASGADGCGRGRDPAR
jgi:L-ascorbate metabolism protein UlaG (beta-lactamase superfamily)